MNTLLSNLLTLAFLGAVFVVLALTAKLTYDDRSTLPPGSPRDWRDDGLRWGRLPIR